MKQIEIYFDDLKGDKQKEILEAYNIKNANDENFDLSPLSILEIE